MTADSTKKVALVTGAGSGIGRATAIMLANKGYAVALVGRTASKLEQTAETIERDGGNADAVACIPTDITDGNAARALPGQVVDALGGLSAVANVAGDAPNCPIGDLTPEIVERCLVTNVNAIANITAGAWPHLAEAGGTIVNVSSIASIDPFPGFAIYAAAKIAVNMFTRVTAAEGADAGIKAVAVAPGAVETPMLRGLFDESFIPRDKTLAPEFIADIIVGCITGERAFEPGETIEAPSPM